MSIDFIYTHSYIDQFRFEVSKFLWKKNIFSLANKDDAMFGFSSC